MFPDQDADAAVEALTIGEMIEVESGAVVKYWA
jgi:hypothetical protein